MVSTEENSSDFDSAWRALSVVMSPEALNAARAASWLTPKAEPKAYGAEEPAALAFLHDDDSVLAPKNPVAKLVVDHNTPVQKDGTGKHVEKRAVEALITTKDIEKIAAEVTQRCMAAGVAPAEIAKLLAKLASNVGASKSSLEDIRGEALKAADDLVSEASGKGSEGAEGQRKDALERINQLSDDIKKNVDEIDPWLTPEERKRIKKAREEEEKAKEKLEWLKANGGTPEQIKAAENAVVKAQVNTAEASNDAAQRAARDNPDKPEVTAPAGKIDQDRRSILEKANSFSQLREEPEKNSKKGINQQNTELPVDADKNRQIGTNSGTLTISTTTFGAVFGGDSLTNLTLAPVVASNTAPLEVAQASASEPTSKSVPFAVVTASSTVGTRGPR